MQMSVFSDSSHDGAVVVFAMCAVCMVLSKVTSQVNCCCLLQSRLSSWISFIAVDGCKLMPDGHLRISVYVISDRSSARHCPSSSSLLHTSCSSSSLPLHLQFPLVCWQLCYSLHSLSCSVCFGYSVDSIVFLPLVSSFARPISHRSDISTALDISTPALNRTWIQATPL